MGRDKLGYAHRHPVTEEEVEELLRTGVQLLGQRKGLVRVVGLTERPHYSYRVNWWCPYLLCQCICGEEFAASVHWFLSCRTVGQCSLGDAKNHIVVTTACAAETISGMELVKIRRGGALLRCRCGKQNVRNLYRLGQIVLEGKSMFCACSRRLPGPREGTALLNGYPMGVQHLARLFGVSMSCVYARKRRGMNTTDAAMLLLQPSGKRKKDEA